VNNLQRAVTTWNESQKNEITFTILKRTLAPPRIPSMSGAVSAFETWAVLRDFWQLCQQSTCFELSRLRRQCATGGERGQDDLGVSLPKSPCGDDKLLARFNRHDGPNAAQLCRQGSGRGLALTDRTVRLRFRAQELTRTGLPAICNSRLPLSRPATHLAAAVAPVCAINQLARYRRP